jgi:hypothetical protein
MVFFRSYADDDAWAADAAEKADALFVCAVTVQFLRYSRLRPLPDVRSRVFTESPRLWIRRFTGSRKVTVCPGTERARELLLLSARDGGQLIETRIDAKASEQPRIILASIPLDDHETIDRHEMDVVWLYPQLNERLYLCKKLGRNVDPEKDLTFGRPMPDDYGVYIDMLARHGRPEDWGYSSEPV